MMWKALLVGAVAFVIAGSSLASAQQRDAQTERGTGTPLPQQDRTQSMNAGVASRIASLKERLRLTPEQEKNWPAYAAALQAVMEQHRQRVEARDQQVSTSDPVQRMRQRAEALSGMGAALSRLVDAEAPLYTSLNADQKDQFASLSRMLRDQRDSYRRSRSRDSNDDRLGRGGREDDRDGRGWGGEGDRSGWRDRGDNGDRRGWRDRRDVARAAPAAIVAVLTAASPTATVAVDGNRRSWRGRDDYGRCDCSGRSDRRDRRDGWGRRYDDDDDIED
jgi:zinc resistance-associated protein